MAREKFAHFVVDFWRLVVDGFFVLADAAFVKVVAFVGVDDVLLFDCTWVRFVAVN